MVEKVREADVHSPKRWAAGPTPTSRREVMMWRLEVRQQRYSRRSEQQQLLADQAKNGQTGRSIREMLITQNKKNRTRNLELGGGLEIGDGGGCVIGIVELEEQVSAKGGKTHRGGPHEARNLL